MESRMGQTWARWNDLEWRWTHRFAPDLAPLRSSGCYCIVAETRMAG